MNAVHTVTYKVTGGTATSVTYTGANGMEQVSDISLPYKRDVQSKGFTLASLTAQNGGQAASIGCEILIDGESKAKQESSGQFAIVTCTVSDF
ncbi:MmpS family transport accessory protein [Actinoplanes sp. CA-054009]